MKNLIALVLLTFSFLSCSNDDTPSNSGPTVNDVVNTVNNGTWRVTLFDEGGISHTNHFTGYNFTFGAGNVLTATNGTDTNTGTWIVSNGGSNDDSPNDIDFIIAFSSPENFVDISEDWQVLERTDNRIRLRHISGGDGSIDLLTFEKN